MHQANYNHVIKYSGMVSESNYEVQNGNGNSEERSSIFSAGKKILIKRAATNHPVQTKGEKVHEDDDDVEETVRMLEKEEFLSKLGKHEKLRIIKNVVFLGLAFMIHFTAFHGSANLLSSVNSEQSLGTFTLASVYGSLILSNIFLPVIVIR